MPGRLFRVIALLGLAAACGGPSEGIDVSVKMSPLLQAEATRATISLFNAPVKCQILRISEKPGVYNVDVVIANGQSADFFEIVPADYQIAVFVYDAAGALIGFGCDPTQVTIEQGKRVDRGPITVSPI